MNLLKRAFLLGAVAAVLPAAQAAPVKRAAPVRKAPPPRRPAAPARAPAPPPLRSPVLLTVSGAIKKSNRGPLDKAIDQMAAKHGLAWEQAYTFDAAALANLPAETIHPTLEYDAKPHTLSGPPLEMVLATLGITPGQAGVMLALRAVDGYRMELSLADVRAWKMILATRIDGQSLAIGGLGPLWAVYDADRLPGIAELPLAERFQRCPWGLYHIEVIQT
ncbi:molybdopterin-dependent oxidoreductase [Ideonella alba]|uniref:molybdopterin-dependent oxidoreductase n=1 Tax=Ideonella alba TaxID=2824118 RepID=UPI001FFDDAD9|nr:molybdopterin-dependent oxidoreductase [Ideonella alba]